VRGTMARIAARKHLATLHSVKGGIYLRKAEPPPPQRIVRLTGIESGGDYMPANPHQCRLYASRFFALAKNARSRKARQIFAEMGETWNLLAAEAESVKRCYRQFLRGSFAGLMMICLTPWSFA
jgi:hypothetical protein